MASWTKAKSSPCLEAMLDCLTISRVTTSKEPPKEMQLTATCEEDTALITKNLSIYMNYTSSRGLGANFEARWTTRGVAERLEEICRPTQLIISWQQTKKDLGNWWFCLPNHRLANLGLWWSTSTKHYRSKKPREGIPCTGSKPTVASWMSSNA